MTVTQLLATEELNGLSNPEVSALLTQLRDANKVVRTVEKKVAYYSINEEVEEQGESPTTSKGGVNNDQQRKRKNDPRLYEEIRHQQRRSRTAVRR